VHQVVPRAKIISVILCMITVFFATDWLTYGILILFILLLTKLAKLAIIFLLDRLKLVFILLIFTFFIHIFLTKGGSVLIDGGFFTIESEGVITGIFITIRLVLLVIITSLMTLTTSPIELTDAIEKLCKPLIAIKVPVHEIAMMMS